MSKLSTMCMVNKIWVINPAPNFVKPNPIQAKVAKYCNRIFFIMFQVISYKEWLYVLIIHLNKKKTVKNSKKHQRRKKKHQNLIKFELLSLFYYDVFN